MAAQSALDGTAGTLCVGLINYEVNGANGRDREQGARDALRKADAPGSLPPSSTHPNAASARADTLAMLRTHPEINVLIALNETTAVGAAQAVQQMQRADDLWLAASTRTSKRLTPADRYGGRADRAEHLRYGLFRRRKRLQAAGRAGEQRRKSNITATRTITRENMFAMDKQKVLFPFG